MVGRKNKINIRKISVELVFLFSNDIKRMKPKALCAYILETERCMLAFDF